MTESGYWSEAFDTHSQDSDGQTKAKPPAQWHEYLHTKQGPVSLAFPTGEDFHAMAFAQRVGDFQIVEFGHSPLDYQRSPRDVRIDEDDSYRVLIPLQGSFKAEQGDAREIFQPGDVAFFHWSRKFFMTQDAPMTSVIMTVPTNLVDAVHAENAPLKLDGKLALIRSLRTQVLSLSESREGWTKEHFEVAYTSALRMLDQALAPARPLTPEGLTGIDRVRWEMQEHAADPTVTVEAIAGFCGTTVRTLRNWLNREGFSPYEMFLDIRLQRARQQLSLPIGVDRIASQTGFTSERRFREAFQRRYGITPAQLREQLAADRRR